MVEYLYQVKAQSDVMARDFGREGSSLNRLLDDLIVIIAPSKNSDGMELNNRFNFVGADLIHDSTDFDCRF